MVSYIRGSCGGGCSGSLRSVEVFGGEKREVCSLGHVLAQEPIGVLVRTSLPGAVGVAEVDRDAGVDREVDMAVHLFALVPGDGAHQILGQLADRGFAWPRPPDLPSTHRVGATTARSGWSARPGCRPPIGCPCR